MRLANVAFASAPAAEGYPVRRRVAASSRCFCALVPRSTTIAPAFCRAVTNAARTRPCCTSGRRPPRPNSSENQSTGLVQLNRTDTGTLGSNHPERCVEQPEAQQHLSQVNDCHVPPLPLPLRFLFPLGPHFNHGSSQKEGKQNRRCATVAIVAHLPSMIPWLPSRSLAKRRGHRFWSSTQLGPWRIRREGSRSRATRGCRWKVDCLGAFARIVSGRFLTEGRRL